MKKMLMFSVSDFQIQNEGKLQATFSSSDPWRRPC